MSCVCLPRARPLRARRSAPLQNDLNVNPSGGSSGLLAQYAHLFMKFESENQKAGAAWVTRTPDPRITNCGSRLHKPEGHAIGFADGLHLRVLCCGTGQIRWQTMYVDI